MTKAEIVELISTQTGVEKKIAMAVFESAMKNIKNEMCKGKNIYLRGFGTFLVKLRRKKPGRVIKTGATVMIPAHYIPFFWASKQFKNKMKKECPIKK